MQENQNQKINYELQRTLNTTFMKMKDINFHSVEIELNLKKYRQSIFV